MITKRDKEIIKFAETHGSITINQCALMFFRDNKAAYDQARKRLRIIYDLNLLKRYRKDPRSEAIYFIDKPLKIHDIKLMDVFAELSKYEVIMFEKECKIEIDKDTNYRVDAYAIIKIDGRFIPLMIEIDYTHFTNIKKIKQITYGYEIDNKVKLTFIIVKLDQMDADVIIIPDKNKYIVLPWNLKGIKNIISLLQGAATVVQESSNSKG